MPYKDKEIDKARRSDPEYRARLNARNRERYANDPEYRETVNQRNKERMAYKRANDPEFWAKDIERRRKWKWRDTLKERYGITTQEYDELYAKQEGMCAICGKDILNGQSSEQKSAKQNYQTCVDHCHTSGKVRGLLCWHCNTGLGHFRDDIESLEKAIRYLKGGDA